MTHSPEPVRYTDEQRAHVLAVLFANGGNVSKTARETGVRRETIIKWRNVVEPSLAGQVSAPVADSADTLAELVRTEIGYIGFGNLSDVVAWDAEGRLRFTPSDELTPAQAAIIQEIRVKRRHDLTGKDEDATVYEVEDFAIKTRDKLGALKTLAEITGLKPTGTTVNLNDQRGANVVQVFGDLSLEEKRAALRELSEGRE